MRVVAVPCLSDNFAYLVISGTRAAVVDPSEAAPIEAALAKEGVTLAAIWCTHHHWDHTGGVADLVDKHPGIDVVISTIDADKLKPETRRCVTKLVGDGDHVALDNVVAKVILNPGHTLGAVSFHIEAEPACVFTGDTLFAAGCGRVFEGDPPMMHASLKKLAALPPETLVYFGHEYTVANLKFAHAAEPNNYKIKNRLVALTTPPVPTTPTTPTTIKLERDTNPFLRASDDADFAKRREWKNNFK